MITDFRTETTIEITGTTTTKNTRDTEGTITTGMIVITTAITTGGDLV
jgi:hypothetical protein